MSTLWMNCHLRLIAGIVKVLEQAYACGKWHRIWHKLKKTMHILKHKEIKQDLKESQLQAMTSL